MAFSLLLAIYGPLEILHADIYWGLDLLEVLYIGALCSDTMARFS